MQTAVLDVLKYFKYNQAQFDGWCKHRALDFTRPNGKNVAQKVIQNRSEKGGILF